jgi:type II secretory pathway pseudopilin PulG
MKIRTFHINQSQCGYTLLELLLYIAIVGALLTSVTFFFGVTLDARVKNQTIVEVNEQGTALIDSITQTIRNSTSITAPTIGTSGASLTLVVPTGALSPTVFSLSSGIVQIKEGAGALTPLNSNKVQVSSLTFKNLSRASTPGSVQISFVMTRLNPNNKNEYDYQKTFTSTAELAW